MKKQVEIKAWIQAFFCQDQGTTVIEYGLIACGISLALLTVVFLFGEDLTVTYEYMAARMDDVVARLGS